MPASGVSGKYFSGTEQVTAAKLHQIIESAAISGFDQSNMASGSGVVVASGTAPSDTDALWYDTNLGILRFNDGTSWQPVSGGEVLTNKSGVSVDRGDVVIWDVANDSSFTTTASAGHPLFAGIAAETIANNQTGIIMTSGKFVVNLSAALATTDRINALSTSTSAKKALVTSSANANAELVTGTNLFGIATGLGTNLVPCFIWGNGALT